ncbi:glycosyltransferase family protein [Hymenobacter mucosus]|nr:glycosyltransferase family protein [Hymenobacter mucosus]
MGSTRLPGKILRTARGISMLEFHVRRLQASGLPVYIATTTLPEDDVTELHARQLGIPCFRGSSDDVLSRYHGAATEFGLDTIVRVTSDCPLIDGVLVRQGVEQYQIAANPHLYLSNGIIRTFPRGFDFEVFSAGLLAEAQRLATSDSDREHVTPYIHQNRSGNVAYAHITREADASRLRVTLDTPEDFDLLHTLLAQYHADDLSGEALIALLEAHPELVALNAEIEQKKYDFTR